jgi:hypothetical protein
MQLSVAAAGVVDFANGRAWGIVLPEVEWQAAKKSRRRQAKARQLHHMTQ